MSFFLHFTTVVQQLASQIYYIPDNVVIYSDSSIKWNAYLINKCNLQNEYSKAE